LEALEANARAKLSEAKAPTRDKEWFRRNLTVPTAPIFISSTEDIGTARVRANHVDAAIHYCEQQEALKKSKAPIE